MAPRPRGLASNPAQTRSTLSAKSCARVLVVEDEPALRRAMARELRIEFDVSLAGGLSSALDILHRGEELCAVVSDLMMDGPVGLELLEEVRRRTPACARVLVSGTVTRDDIDDALASGTVQHFISKPWDAGALLAAVRRAVDARV